MFGLILFGTIAVMCVSLSGNFLLDYLVKRRERSKTWSDS